MWRLGLRGAALVALGAVLTGCTDPLDKKVPASTAARFASWRAQVASDASVKVRAQVDAALREIRLAVAGDHELKRRRGEPVEAAPGAIDDAVRALVDGRSVRDVIQVGLELRVGRLKSELAGLDDAVDKNAQLITRPGDTEARRILEDLRARQTKRLANYRAELATTEGELAPMLQGRSRILPPKAAEPAELDVAPVRAR